MTTNTPKSPTPSSTPDATALPTAPLMTPTISAAGNRAQAHTTVHAAASTSANGATNNTNPEPLLAVRNLCKRFTNDGPLIVNNVSFDLHANEILALVGPSGCGKTTTLRLIAGFERADAGEIQLHGQPLVQSLTAATQPKVLHTPPEQRGIGIVFQDYALFPHLSVLGNVMFGMKGPKKDHRNQAMALLDMLHMADYAKRRPYALSGGQQQRVALVRTLAAAPRMVLLDEPFSNLDVSLREQAREDVRHTLQQQGIAAVLVTHDREEALSVGDRVAVMSQGSIIQVDMPEKIYHQPVDAFVGHFLGGLLELPAKAMGSHARCVLGSVALNRPAQGNIQIALRPEQLVLASSDHACSDTSCTQTNCTQVIGKVEQREFRGHSQTLRIRVGDLLLPVHADSQVGHKIGDDVTICVAGVAHVFEG